MFCCCLFTHFPFTWRMLLCYISKNLRKSCCVDYFPNHNCCHKTVIVITINASATMSDFHWLCAAQFHTSLVADVTGRMLTHFLLLLLLQAMPAHIAEKKSVRSAMNGPLPDMKDDDVSPDLFHSSLNLAVCFAFWY